MKFRVEKEVFEKFPNMLWIIPIVLGFNNNPAEETKKEIVDFLRSEEEKLKQRFPTIESLEENPKVQRYKELFAAIGANTRKVFPTHIAMARRVIEGGQIPDINPALNICNALSLKYLTPFGEENLASVYGDFYLTFAKGDEQWICLGKTESESPKPGELVWRDGFDISSRYLNWRQGERTKLDAEVKDGYFIMDSFNDLDRDNVEQTADEFVQLMAKWLGGESKIYRVDKDNPEVEVDYKTKELDQFSGNIKFDHNKLGITNGLYAVIKNVNITSENPDLETIKQNIFNEVLKLSEDEINQNQIVKGYRELLVELNHSDEIPAGENFVKLIKEKNKFPTINTAVDAYNTIVAKSFLAIGAHDLDKVKGDIAFDFAQAGEKIPAVNMQNEFEVREGDYVYRDNEKILAWLDVRDSDLAKITNKTKNIVLIIEGNRNTSKEFILDNLKEACDLIIRFNGGSYEIKNIVDNQLVLKSAEAKSIENKTKAQSKRAEIKTYLFPHDSNAFRIQNLLVKVLHSMGVDKSVDEIHLEQPTNEQFGDYSTNVAMTLAGELKQNPRQIADQIIANIKNPEIGGDEHFLSRIEVAGPGFINFTINSDLIKEELIKVLEQGDDYGKSDLRKGKLVMVEFGQPNTHKAFHIGHLKSAVSGLSMVRLHEALGYDVIKANYYGDVGMHVARSIWGYMQKGKPDAFEVWDEHKRMKYIDECYVYGSAQFKEDETAKAEIKAINKKVYDKSDPQINEVYEQTRTWSLEHLNSMFKELGVEYDVQYPESTTFKHGIELVKEHIGDIFEESDGAIIYDGKKEGLTTWVFLTQEGIPTYSAKDLGLGHKKFEDYDLDLSVYTTSVEQKDYFKVVFRCLELIRPDLKGKSIHVPFGWMLREGRKMSSRQGQTLKGMDLLEEIKGKANDLISVEKEYSEEERAEVSHAVAMAGLKFVILSHEFHKDFNYDPDKFLSFSGFSGPYLLYTYARAKSILAKTGMEIKPGGVVFAEDTEKEVGKMKFREFNSILKSDYEISLLRHINRFGDTVMAAGLNISPHIICTYLYELAQRFNQFYTNIQVATAEEGQKEARVMLTAATAQVLKNGLRMLGIDTVEKM